MSYVYLPDDHRTYEHDGCRMVVDDPLSYMGRRFCNRVTSGHFCGPHADKLSSLLGQRQVEDWRREERMRRIEAMAPSVHGEAPEGSGTYVVTNLASGLTKIGMSTQISRRLRDLQLASGSPLLYMGGTGETTDEKQLHQLFAYCRVYGEWFELSADDWTDLRRAGVVSWSGRHPREVHDRRAVMSGTQNGNDNRGAPSHPAIARYQHLRDLMEVAL